jgi:hypothetical protein
MWRFRTKSLIVAMIVFSLMAMLAIMTRSSLQSAGAADTAGHIQRKKDQLKEAFRLAEGQ